MDIITVCGFCIASVIACKALESDNRHVKTVLVLLVCAIFLLSSAGYIKQIFSTVKSILDSAKIDDMYIKIVFKSLGVIYLSQFAADYCKDCGENAIASQVILAGKVSVLVISLPLFKAFTEIIKSLII